MADELIDSVLATTMNARVCRALVDVTEASGIIISTETFALEAIDEINADAVVGAWR